LKESLAKENSGTAEEEKKDEEPKFQAFTGKGISLGDASNEESGGSKEAAIDTNSELYQTLAQQYGDDPEMISAIIASMQTDAVE
jgi:hypothetical protein